MRTVTCYECRKKYDYTEDGFCPRCGSFNQPRKGSYIVSANGDIVRTDGINEAGHENSFVHAEYHTEERERKRLGLDRETVSAKTRHAKAAHTQKKPHPIGVLFLAIWLSALIMIILATVFSLF